MAERFSGRRYFVLGVTQECLISCPWNTALYTVGSFSYIQFIQHALRPHMLVKEIVNLASLAQKTTVFKLKKMMFFFFLIIYQARKVTYSINFQYSGVGVQVLFKRKGNNKAQYINNQNVQNVKQSNKKETLTPHSTQPKINRSSKLVCHLLYSCNHDYWIIAVIITKCLENQSSRTKPF